MTLSYKVCTFSNLVGPYATSGPEGFPNNGLALRRGSPSLEFSRGLLKRVKRMYTIHNWLSPLMARGKEYFTSMPKSWRR